MQPPPPPQQQQQLYNVPRQQQQQQPQRPNSLKRVGNSCSSKPVTCVSFPFSCTHRSRDRTVPSSRRWDCGAWWPAVCLRNGNDCYWNKVRPYQPTIDTTLSSCGCFGPCYRPVRRGSSTEAQGGNNTWLDASKKFEAWQMAWKVSSRGACPLPMRILYKSSSMPRSGCIPLWFFPRALIYSWVFWVLWYSPRATKDSLIWPSNSLIHFITRIFGMAAMLLSSIRWLPRPMPIPWDGWIVCQPCPLPNETLNRGNSMIIFYQKTALLSKRQPNVSSNKPKQPP